MTLVEIYELTQGNTQESASCQALRQVTPAGGQLLHLQRKVSNCQ
jgi:hypothetical protein